MKVDDAIKNIKMFHFKNLPRFKPELIELLKSLKAENKKLKKFKDMWEWIQGVEMWNKEYEKIVKEVVQDIEVGYMSGKTIEQIGYEKVDDSLVNGIFNKQNQKYIKKINTLEKLKQENKALRKDKWELEGINEACRRENKAYREMWKELKPTDDYECLILEERHLLSKMGNLENKYLGGEK